MIYKNREKFDKIWKGTVFWPIGLDRYWIKDSKTVFAMVGSRPRSESAAWRILSAACCWLRAMCNLTWRVLRAACCATLAARHLLCDTCCAVFTARHLLRVICCATFAGRHLLRDICCAAFAARHLLRGICCATLAALFLSLNSYFILYCFSILLLFLGNLCIFILFYYNQYIMGIFLKTIKNKYFKYIMK